MEWLKRNAMDCLKYGYGYKSFLEFNDYEKGLIKNKSTGETYTCNPVPAHIMALIERGGLVEHLKERLASH